MRLSIFIKPLLILVMSVLLISCSLLKPQPETVTKYEVKVLDFPAALLEPCPASAPPDRNEYEQSTYQEKEDLLTNYTLELLTDLKTCNDQILKIKTIRDSQMQSVKKLKK